MTESIEQIQVLEELTDALVAASDLGLTEYVGFWVRGKELVAEVVGLDGEIESTWQVTITLTEVGP